MGYYLRIGKQKVDVNEEVYRQYRKSQRREKYLNEQEQANGVVSFEELYIPPASKYNVEEDFEREERSRKLWSALNKLSADEFDFVNLHFFEDYSLKEIAEMKQTTYIWCWRKRKATLQKLRLMIGEID